MEENKIIEAMNEEVVYEEVTNSNKGGFLKTTALIMVGAAVGYGIYKGVKKLVKVVKSKQQTEFVEPEYVNDDESTNE